MSTVKWALAQVLVLHTLEGSRQTKCFQIMALSILRQTSCPKCSFLNYGQWITDIANKKQFGVCSCWVGESLTNHEDVIGVYNIVTIDANTLTAAIRNVLLHMTLVTAQCRGQYYDGASNMTGSKHSVAAQLFAEELRAHLTNCYGRALILAVTDAMKQSKVCSDTLGTAFQITILIHLSPKRIPAFLKIIVENPAEDKSVPSNGICSFCPTRWNVSGNAIESMSALRPSWNQMWKVASSVYDSSVALQHSVWSTTLQ